MNIERRIAKLETGTARDQGGPWGWVIAAEGEAQHQAVARTYPEGPPPRLVIWNVVSPPGASNPGGEQ